MLRLFAYLVAAYLASSSNAIASIQVISASYGPNCGAPQNNVKAQLAAACDGKDQCEYVIDYKVLGDPAPGCPKTFVADWTCAAGAAAHSATIAAEAGFQSRIVLACPRLPRDIAKVNRITLEITGIEPAAPVAGQQITVNYQLHNLGAGNNPVTGAVLGSFQDRELRQPDNSPIPVVTVQPGQMMSGSLVGAAPNPGEGDVVLQFNEGCAPRAGIAAVPCKLSALAEARVALNVTPEMVSVRIAGANYIELSKGDSNDGVYQRNGGLCVVHYTGCNSWIFSSGNDGDDKFFTERRPLPAGAKVVTYKFRPQWPPGLNAVDRGGVGSWGSYGAVSSYDPAQPPHLTVHWENACQGTWAGRSIVYDVSFIVSMPKGTDLGEPTSDPDQLNVEVCSPDSTVNLPINDPPDTPGPLYFALLRQEGRLSGGPIPYANRFGLNSPGTIVAIQNAEGFQIELVADGATTADCGKGSDKTLLLGPQQTTTPEQIADLYGSATNYPRDIIGCSWVERSGIGLAVTHLPQ